jgi:hypothetical protein
MRLMLAKLTHLLLAAIVARRFALPAVVGAGSSGLVLLIGVGWVAALAGTAAVAGILGLVTHSRQPEHVERAAQRREQRREQRRDTRGWARTWALARSLGEPWRSEALASLDARRQFHRASTQTDQGPLADRLASIARSVDTGVVEALRLAERGDRLSRARLEIDSVGALRMLAEIRSLQTRWPLADPELAGTARSIEAQLAVAARLDAMIRRSASCLVLTNARLQEAVARAVELSVIAASPEDASALGEDVERLVADLEAVRLGLEELDRVEDAFAPSPAPGWQARPLTPAVPDLYQRSS